MPEKVPLGTAGICLNILIIQRKFSMALPTFSPLPFDHCFRSKPIIRLSMSSSKSARWAHFESIRAGRKYLSRSSWN